MKIGRAFLRWLTVSDMSRTLSHSQFVKITAAGSARIVQFALKFES
jgi:hypothetical protein